MSKNTNLSFLTDYITADITNGRIGINNASPTVAFDVSGATKISGVLTLTSTISNGTYTYTLPSATGTLALTSALSSYLPLTGGTLTGALGGTSATFSGNVSVNNTSNAVSIIVTGSNSGSTGGSSIIAGTTGISNIAIGNRSCILGGGYDSTAMVYWGNSGSLVFNNGISDKLTIASTGAATFSSSVASTWHSVNGAIPSSAASTGYLDYSGGGTRLFSVGTSGATKGTFTFIAKGADDSSITPLSISNTGITTIMTNDNIVLKATNVNQAMYIDYRNSAGTRRSYMGFGGDSNSNFDIWNSENGAMAFGTNNTERMRILSGGQVLINRSSATTTEEVLGIKGKATSTAVDLQIGTNGYYGIRFGNSSNTTVGSIQIDASATQYTTSSDYRFKEDLKEIKGLEKVSAIKVYDFKWKSSEDRMDGVLAHELQEVVPFAVTGIKDGEDMQGVDYSKLVPVLVKAIQELSAKVSLLENK